MPSVLSGRDFKNSEESGKKQKFWIRLLLTLVFLGMGAGACFLVLKTGLPDRLVVQDKEINSAESVSAVAKANLNVRAGSGTQYTVLCTVPKGASVSLPEGQQAGKDGWVRVKTSGGQDGWCSAAYLDFVGTSSKADSAPASSAVSSSVSGGLKQAAALPSVSLEKAEKPLSIQVLLSDQKVRVLDSRGRLVKEFICSSGEKGSETPVGTFTISDRGESFFNAKVNEGAYYWTRFYGTYLFHSVPFDKNRKMEKEEADKLGEPASHGCIRLPVEDAKWIYDNIPEGTKVTIE